MYDMCIKQFFSYSFVDINLSVLLINMEFVLLVLSQFLNRILALSDTVNK